MCAQPNRIFVVSLRAFIAFSTRASHLRSGASDSVVSELFCASIAHTAGSTVGHLSQFALNPKHVPDSAEAHGGSDYLRNIGGRKKADLMGLLRERGLMVEDAQDQLGL